MAKTTKKDFKIFRSECQKWIDRFGLIGYEARYYHDDKKAGGGCSVYLPENWLELRLNIDVDNSKDCSFEEQIKIIAKHECIHALVGRLAVNGASRWLNKEEYNESEEELVRKLEKLIN